MYVFFFFQLTFTRILFSLCWNEVFFSHRIINNSLCLSMLVTWPFRIPKQWHPGEQEMDIPCPSSNVFSCAHAAIVTVQKVGQKNTRRHLTLPLFPPCVTVNAVIYPAVCEGRLQRKTIYCLPYNYAVSVSEFNWRWSSSHISLFGGAHFITETDSSISGPWALSCPSGLGGGWRWGRAVWGGTQHEWKQLALSRRDCQGR